MMPYQDLREECCEANIALGESGLVDLTFGNVSVYDKDADVFAIKPSGVAYAQLSPADMVIVDRDGNVVEGALRPSSDTPTHLCLFRAFGERGVRSIVHTHSRCSVAFAQAGREIPCLGTTHADHFNGPVPVTRAMRDEEIRGEYEWETGRVIVERFKGLDPAAIPAVLVRGHGPFAWGPSGDKALENARALEICGDLALKTLALAADTKTLNRTLHERHFSRKHGDGAYYGQS